MRLHEIASDISNYFLEGGCAEFAYALWLAHGKRGEFGVIASNFGDGWNDDIDFECTHVYFEIDNQEMDVMGIRSTRDMAKYFNLNADFNDYDNHSGYEPQSFIETFCAEDGPLEFDESNLQQAQMIIIANPQKYGLTQIIT